MEKYEKDVRGMIDKYQDEIILTRAIVRAVFVTWFAIHIPIWIITLA
jgi:hypothetical protein